MRTLLRRRLPDLPRATYLLTLGQALNLTCAVISVTIAALVGSRLAATPALGTLPYGVQFASVMLFTYPASMLMRRHGRRPIFSLGAALLIVSGVLGYLAVTRGDFGLLIATHAILGVYIACANFYRFAAVDHLEPAAKPKALSLVVAGGVIAAVAGPAIANSLRTVAGFADFSLCYAAFCVLGAATLVLMALWRPQPAVAEPAPRTAAAARRMPLGASLPIFVAIFCSAGAYFLMNLLMVQASLVMADICSFAATSTAIQVHVLSMFAPSFVTGAVITRIGLRRTLMAGFLLLAGAMVLGMQDIRYASVFGALTLLGLGWNLAYVGGGALLAQSVDERDRHRWQGINDTVIAACATLGAFLPAPLLAGLGWNRSNLALAPLCVLGIVLCWRALARHGAVRPRLATGTSAE
jgi:predicted MFS family arabinose efflux permease